MSVLINCLWFLQSFDWCKLKANKTGMNKHNITIISESHISKDILNMNAHVQCILQGKKYEGFYCMHVFSYNGFLPT